jgi:hypothetical protein
MPSARHRSRPPFGWEAWERLRFGCVAVVNNSGFLGFGLRQNADGLGAGLLGGVRGLAVLAGTYFKYVMDVWAPNRKCGDGSEFEFGPRLFID